MKIQASSIQRQFSEIQTLVSKNKHLETKTSPLQVDKEDQKLKEASKKLEGQFLSFLIKSMESTIPKEDNKQSLATMMFSSVMGKEMSENMNIPFLGSLPLDPEIMMAGDNGKPVLTNGKDTPAAKALLSLAENFKKSIDENLAKILAVEVSHIPARAEELFQIWKKAKKAAKKGQLLDFAELELKKLEIYEGDILGKTAEVLKTQKEHILNTIKRFNYGQKTIL